MFILMILTIFIVLYITGYHFSNFLNHIYLFVLQLIISMMFCVVDWCMHMPINSLLETTDSDKGCIYKVFQVLTIIFLAFTFIHHSLCHFCIWNILFNSSKMQEKENTDKICQMTNFYFKLYLLLVRIYLYWLIFFFYL